ncbi:MAG TPA: YceI family protein, partial [Acidimicrobiia bacterium]|nr:YceI family protein [Acidimicrobiia bacterium]
MTAIQTTRVLDGQELPAAGTYTLDPAHSTVGFIARHLVFTKVRGRFTEFDATVHIADVPSESSVEATIKVASIDTGQKDRDAHLLSPDFFDAEHYPTITFKSTGVQPAGG